MRTYSSKICSVSSNSEKNNFSCFNNKLQQASLRLQQLSWIWTIVLQLVKKHFYGLKQPSFYLGQVLQSNVAFTSDGASIFRVYKNFTSSTLLPGPVPTTGTFSRRLILMSLKTGWCSLNSVITEAKSASEQTRVREPDDPN